MDHGTSQYGIRAEVISQLSNSGSGVLRRGDFVRVCARAYRERVLGSDPMAVKNLCLWVTRLDGV